MGTDNCTLPAAGGAIAPPKSRTVRVVKKDYTDKREKKFESAKNPLILHTKLEELMRYTHVALQQFPKKERYQLCADIKTALYEAMKLTIRMERRYHKKTTLQDIDVSINFLRVLVRLSYSLGYISAGHLEAWMSQVDEAGKILGGLIKYFKENE